MPIIKKMHYQEYGSYTKKALVFLHGNSFDSSVFLKQVNAFKEEFRVITIDLPGHGSSEKLEEYSLPVIAQRVFFVLDSLGLNEFYIIGHSLGGHVAYHLTKYLGPQSIISFGAPPLKKPLDSSSFIAHPRGEVFFKGNLSIEEKTHYLDLCGIEDHRLGKLLDKVDLRFRPNFFKSIVEGNYDSEVDLLQESSAYKYFILPEDDILVNPEYITKVSSKLKKSSVLFTRGGHSPQVSHSEVFNSLLLEIIKTKHNSKYFEEVHERTASN